MSTPAFTLGFPQLEREISSHEGETIFQAARRSGVRIIGACGGRGVCGTCRVLLVSGTVAYEEEPMTLSPEEAH